MRLLIVEDDVRVCEALAAALAQRGNEVLCAGTAEAALGLLELRPDAVVLDDGLPDGEGFAVCAAIRAVTAVPLILTTAHSDSAACISALDAGADDCLVKPYNLEELLARVRAVRRRYLAPGTLPGAAPGADARTGAGGVTGRDADSGARPEHGSELGSDRAPDGAAAEELILAGPVRIDLRERAVLINGCPTELPDEELGILAALARRPGRTLSADQLVAEIQQFMLATLRSTLGSHIERMARRVGTARLLAADDGTGYRLAIAETASEPAESVEIRFFAGSVGIPLAPSCALYSLSGLGYRARLAAEGPWPRDELNQATADRRPWRRPAAGRRDGLCGRWKGRAHRDFDAEHE